MPTHTNSQMDKPAGRPARLLLGLTAALFALLILNLAVFDDLRVDPSAGVLETFAKPQHLSSLLVVLIAGALVAFRHRSAARVAVAVATIEIVAFTFFHAIPVEVGPSKPYWVTAWETRCSGWASCRSSPSAQPSSALHGDPRTPPLRRPLRAGPRENSVINLERTLRPEVVGFSHLRSMLVVSSQAHSTAASTWIRVESNTGVDAS